MTKKQVARNVKIANLMHAIDVLAHQMAQGMIQADVRYVAQTGRMTPHMEMVWNKFVEIAIEGAKVGL